MRKDLCVLLAPDSFKESMTAKEACEAMEKGIKKINKNIKCIQVPMADGGEGTMQSLGGKLMDKNGKEIGFGGGELGKLKKINLTDFDERLNDVKVEIACDVDNPLCGRKGASNVLILKKEQHQRWLKSLMII